MKKFKYVSLFAGIGGFDYALNHLGGKCVMASEIDVYANQAYELLYGYETVGDITKIAAEDVPDHDVLVGGFPCQAFSVAGRRLGFEDTRGTLFFEVARIAAVKKPKIIFLENVKGLVSHDGGRTLDVIAQTINDLGYALDFNVLNSKFYGVPQNRERIFLVAARDMDHQDWILPAKMGVVGKAKKRISALGIKTFNFDWPTNNTVTTKLLDILEDTVDEKYYLSDEKTTKLLTQLRDRSQLKGEPPLPLNIVSRGAESRGDGIAYCLKGIEGGSSKQHLLEPFIVDTRQHIDGARAYHDAVPTLTGTDYKEPKQVAIPQDLDSDINVVGRLDEINGHDLCKRVYGSDGVSPTIPTGSSGNTMPKIAVQMNRSEIFKQMDVSHCLMARDHKGYGNQEMTGIIEQVRPCLTPDRVEKRQNGRRFKEDGEEMFTLTAQDIHGVAIRKVGQLPSDPSQTGSVYDPQGIAPTHMRQHGNAVTKIISPKWRIRKLIPLECFRLQGFQDEQFFKLQAAGISDTQLYKMAGNAVTINVVEAIGERMVRML